MRLHLFAAGAEKDEPSDDASARTAHEHQADGGAGGNAKKRPQEDRKSVAKEVDSVNRRVNHDIPAQLDGEAAQKEHNQQQKDSQGEIDSPVGRELQAKALGLLGSSRKAR